MGLTIRGLLHGFSEGFHLQNVEIFLDKIISLQGKLQLVVSY